MKADLVLVISPEAPLMKQLGKVLGKMVTPYDFSTICKKSVEKALTAQNGVIRADADVDRGIARVFYENGVDDAKLQEAVEKEGFVVKNIETVV